MRVGIFGGTFNPPHIGHERCANEASVQLGLDLLVVVPVGVPPHKPLPPDTPCADIRLFMTHTAFSSTRNTIVSNIEVTNPEPSYTIETVNVISKIYPNSDLFLLLGTDMYLSLDTWKDVGLLLEQVTPAVFSRNTNDLIKIMEHSVHIKNRYGADTKTVRNDIIPISSSGLRDMLPDRSGLGYINDTIYSYIIKNRLYDSKPEWCWLRERAYSMLKPERVPHVAACEVAAVSLAERWGADPDDAREAAILHDITKKFGLEPHLRILEDHDPPVGLLLHAGEKLLHQRTGAALAKAIFGTSEAVTQAIRWHTTGRAGMTVLDKVIYLADYIEATRDFDGVEELRQKAFEDIDQAMVMGLEMTVRDISSRGITPDASTLEAIKDLKR